MVNNMEKNKLIVFENKKIRRLWHNEEWFYAVVDIISVLTDSKDPKQYIKKLRSRDEQLNLNWGTICTPLELKAIDGKIRKINCANIKGIFRLIQSVPSKKAEPFKQWLAQVGKERIDEIEDPELAQVRMKELYEQKGYSRDWIDKRLRSIAIRQNLTDEWKERGIENKKAFAILTAEISKATFGMTPAEYKQHKNLEKENLRDHMNDFELILTMLGEKVTTEISKNEMPDTFYKNLQVSKRGGSVAGDARIRTEQEIGKSIISKDNYLKEKEKLKRLK